MSTIQVAVKERCDLMMTPSKTTPLLANCTSRSARTGSVCGGQLKTQHADRPIWVLPDGHIYLEASSPYYHQVRELLG